MSEAVGSVRFGGTLSFAALRKGYLYYYYVFLLLFSGAPVFSPFLLLLLFVFD